MQKVPIANNPQGASHRGPPTGSRTFAIRASTHQGLTPGPTIQSSALHLPIESGCTCVECETGVKSDRVDSRFTRLGGAFFSPSRAHRLRNGASTSRAVWAPCAAILSDGPRGPCTRHEALGDAFPCHGEALTRGRSGGIDRTPTPGIPAVRIPSTPGAGTHGHPRRLQVNAGHRP
jgi:hypothetical protein